MGDRLVRAFERADLLIAARDIARRVVREWELGLLERQGRAPGRPAKQFRSPCTLWPSGLHHIEEGWLPEYAATGLSCSCGLAIAYELDEGGPLR